MGDRNNPYWQPTIQDLLELQEHEREDRRISDEMATRRISGLSSSHSLGAAPPSLAAPSTEYSAADVVSDYEVALREERGRARERTSQASSTSQQPPPPPSPSPAANNYSTSQLSTTSADSFDWLGDDKSIDKEEQEELIFAELVAPPPPPSPSSKTTFWGLLPQRLYDYALLLVFALFVLVAMVKVISRIELPQIFGVSLTRWTGLLFAVCFVPVWTRIALSKVARFLKTTVVFSKTDYPANLEATIPALTLSFTSLTLGLLWTVYFPTTCSPLPIEPIPADPSETGSAGAARRLARKLILPQSQEDVFCPFALARRLFIFITVTGIIFALETLVMRSLRNSFQERTFKNRIISNRFKVFVAEQLLIAAKEEKFLRMAQSPESITTRAAREREEARRKQRNALAEFLINCPFVIAERVVRLVRRVAHRFHRHGPSAIGFRLDESGGSLLESTATSPLLTQQQQMQRRRRPSSFIDGHENFADFKKEMLAQIRSAGYESAVKEHLPRNDGQAKLMARTIFHYLCPSTRNYLKFRDFAAIIANETACRDAFNIFDVDKDGVISKAEFRGAMVRTFREQVNLTQSIANTGSALSILDTIAWWIVMATLSLFLLAILGVNIQSILTVAASVMLGLNFIIFDGANKTFQAVLFLFFNHPYDVGDRIIIGKDVGYGEEDILTVLHINIQTTIFRRWNGLEVNMPNHALSTGPITNLSRCKEQWERIEFSLQGPDRKALSIEDETERLAQVRSSIEGFLQDHPADYYQAFELRAVIAADVAKADRNLDNLKFILKVRCKETSDSQKKWIRHARILAFIKQTISECGVTLAT